MLNFPLINVVSRDAEFKRTAIDIEIGKIVDLAGLCGLQVDFDNSEIDIDDNIETSKELCFECFCDTDDCLNSIDTFCDSIAKQAKVQGLNPSFTQDILDDGSISFNGKGIAIACKIGFSFTDTINPDFECGISFTDNNKYLDN